MYLYYYKNRLVKGLKYLLMVTRDITTLIVAYKDYTFVSVLYLKSKIYI